MNLVRPGSPRLAWYWYAIFSAVSTASDPPLATVDILSLLLSNTAPGFPHWFIGTSGELDSPIGGFDVETFDDDRSPSAPMGSWITAVTAPRPSLENDRIDRDGTALWRALRRSSVRESAC